MEEMAENRSTADILTLSKSVWKNRAAHEREVELNCVKSSVKPLPEFYEEYQREIDKINSEMTPTKVMPSISEFTDVFKSFEVYPINLQKPKRAVSKELQRASSSQSVRDVTTTCATAAPPSARNVLAEEQSDVLAEQQSAAKIYRGFKKFMQSLNQFLQEAKQENDEKYDEKLKQLKTFAEQLEKLRPTLQTSGPAFTDEEEAEFRMILTNFEHLDYIRDNSKIFDDRQADTAPRSESIAELINYLFSQV